MKNPCESCEQVGVSLPCGCTRHTAYVTWKLKQDKSLSRNLSRGEQK